MKINSLLKCEHIHIFDEVNPDNNLFLFKESSKLHKFVSDRNFIENCNILFSCLQYFLP